MSESIVAGGDREGGGNQAGPGVLMLGVNELQERGSSKWEKITFLLT